MVVTQSCGLSQCLSLDLSHFLSKGEDKEGHFLQLFKSLVLAKYESCTVSSVGFLEELTNFRILELEESLGSSLSMKVNSRRVFTSKGTCNR